MSDSPVFLNRLLDAVGPSGFEVAAARLWRAEAETFADSVRTDVSGNTLATVNVDGRPRVMFAGHIDEIGLQITHIDEDGFLYIDRIGGWDPQVLVGQRVKILGPPEGVLGVVGKKAIHLQKSDERRKASEISKLWVDVGVESRAEATALGLRVGDAMVIDATMVKLAGDRIASRAVDNRIGAYVVLEALRLLSEASPTASTVAVATVQEEIGSVGGGGARSSAFGLEPDVALVVDVTFSTDVPDIEKKELGEHRLGGGGRDGGDSLYDSSGGAVHEHGRRFHLPDTIRRPHRAGVCAEPIHAFAERDGESVRSGVHGSFAGSLRVESRWRHRLYAEMTAGLFGRTVGMCKGRSDPVSGRGPVTCSRRSRVS